MCAEFFVDAVMVAFAEEVEIEFGEAGVFEGVGVVENGAGFTCGYAELVVGDFGEFDDAFKEVRVVSRGLHFKFATGFGDEGGDGGGFGLVDAECPEGFAILFYWM